jgi:hypothetical protein
MSYEQDLRHLVSLIPKAAKVLLHIFHGSSDQFERHAADKEAVQANLNCFDEGTVSTLLEHAQEATSSDKLAFAERVFEITQHVLRAKGETEREKLVAFKGGRLCEDLGRYVGAMDWYDIARVASERSDDDATWVKATIKYADAGQKYAGQVHMPGGMDLQLIPEVENAFSKAERIQDQPSLQALAKQLIQMYERRGKGKDAAKLRQRFNI